MFKDNISKIFLGLGVALCSMQASAYVITTGGQYATDGSGLTSSYVDSSNKLNPLDGYFIETFDADTRMYGYDHISQDKSFNWSGLDATNPVSSGCGVNSTALISVTGNLGVKGDGTSNSHGVGAPPGGSDPLIGDKTCFGFTPGTGNSGSVTVDYGAFLSGLTVPAQIDYLGFYWGSIDTYNDFYFYDAQDNLVAEILGTTLLAESGGQTGNQSSPLSNLYINIDFSSNEAFTKFTVVSNGVAGEFDNIVAGLTTRPVPVPAPLALLGLGLVALGWTRRKTA